MNALGTDIVYRWADIAEVFCGIIFIISKLQFSRLFGRVIALSIHELVTERFFPPPINSP